MVDTVPAVDRAQHRHRLVCPGPAVLGSDEVEPVLDILAGDAVQRTFQPVRQVDPQVLAVEPHGVGRAVGISRHVAIEGLSQRRYATRLGAFAGGVFASCDPPEQSWALRRASSGVMRPKRPMTIRLLGALRPPSPGR